MPSRVFTEGIGHTNETVSATVDSSGNLVMAKDIKLPAAGGIKTSGGAVILNEAGGNVSLGDVRLPSSGGIKTSSGNAVINESGGTVTVTNATLGSTVVGGVPVGAVMPLASVTVPTGFVICNGAEYSRTTYANLFAFLSFTDATCDTNSNTTVTMDSTALIGAGFGVSGTGIAVGTTVASVTNSTTFVLSQAATATASNVTLTFTRWGVGTSDSNFRVPDFRGAFLRGTGTGAINGVNKAGETVGLFQVDEMQRHTGGFTAASPGHMGSVSVFEGVGGAISGTQNLVTGQTQGNSQRFQNTSGAASNGFARVFIDIGDGDETRPYNASIQYCIKC